MDFFVKHSKVKVVTSAEFSFRHDKVVSFSAHNYPNNPATGLKRVFFDSALF